ncbi:EAL domain-containing protein [Corallincola spongiicola]|uniref:EAL domain-containing protein n=2 Tax=Corallincola spongiicola TaxID=2520508 RepID=A0ABY1WMM4_9GAMM|nr:EAL domain-containing protein [Corallincola spongiicola]
MVPSEGSRMPKRAQQLSQTHTSKRLRRAARFELAIGVVVVVALTFTTTYFEFELVEALYEFTRSHESWDLDELLLALLWIGMVAVVYGVRRMADIKRLNREISINAYYDPITDLPNRALAIERLNQMLSSAKRRQHSVGVLFLDFDNFKVVNDTYGHAQGDMLIKSVGDRLLSQMRQEDTVARLGGDEFVILLDLSDSDYNILHTVRRIIDSQRIPHIVAEHEIMLNYSIGIAVYPEDGDAPDALLRAADAAMYKAKDEGKGQFHLYSDDIGEALEQRYRLESGLKQAIVANEFYLVFQPQVDLKTGEVIGFEALLRWLHDDELIPPGVFIEVAEETRLIETIGHWVLDRAIQEVKPWLIGDRVIAVNISPKQLQRSDFVRSVQIAIEQHGIKPTSLELEITETALLTDFENSAQKLAALQEMGVKIAIDDFGTGYSSLGRLKDLHVDKLKIDRSFVVSSDARNTNQKIIQATLSLAENLGLRVIAEGVETQEQVEMLQQMHCHQMQGYYFAKPVPAAEISGLDCFAEKQSIAPLSQ